MKALTRLYRAGAAAASALAVASSQAFAFSPPAPADSMLAAAVGYLSVEVPKWKRDNGCYSCHNDGDGLRALIASREQVASASTLSTALKALDDSAAWEAKPLARLQFAGAVRDAVAAGLLSHDKLTAAARAVAADQSADGHWKVEEELAAGSPVTYGPVLATALARSFLTAADPQSHAAAIARATAWLEKRPPGGHVVDLAALVLALNRASDRSRLLAARLANGSWNNEPFDTALAIIALREMRPDTRAWLRSRQLPGGGWPGTTRPPGGESYAQHISTTAWVVLALCLVN